MAFYDLNKNERQEVVNSIHSKLLKDIKLSKKNSFLNFFGDEDTYIRKNAYLAIGKIVKEQKELKAKTLHVLSDLFESKNEKVRQTVVNAAGEIGKIDFNSIVPFMEKGLFDSHHSVRNAMIGSIKKMGEKNPIPTLAFASKYLHHENKEIRREICHGIELRGRTHPEDILPMLKELQFDKTARVRNTLIHVIGQIAYKKGCLETVIAELQHWENKKLVLEAIEEIIDVHDRYKNFSVKTQKEAIAYIETHFKN